MGRAASFLAIVLLLVLLGALPPAQAAVHLVAIELPPAPLPNDGTSVTVVADWTVDCSDVLARARDAPPSYAMSTWRFASEGGLSVAGSPSRPVDATPCKTQPAQPLALHESFQLAAQATAAGLRPLNASLSVTLEPADSTAAAAPPVSDTHNFTTTVLAHPLLDASFPPTLLHARGQPISLDITLRNAGNVPLDVSVTARSVADPESGAIDGSPTWTLQRPVHLAFPAAGNLPHAQVVLNFTPGSWSKTRVQVTLDGSVPGSALHANTQQAVFLVANDVPTKKSAATSVPLAALLLGFAAILHRSGPLGRPGRLRATQAETFQREHLKGETSATVVVRG